jgi:hypothetical protein
MLKNMILKDLESSQPGTSVTADIIFDLLYVGSKHENYNTILSEEEEEVQRLQEKNSCKQCCENRLPTKKREIERFLKFIFDEDLN